MSDNMRGALFMTLAMGLFALEDMALKAAAADIPVGQAAFLFGVAGIVVFAGTARLAGHRAIHPAVTSPTMLLRSLSEIAGRLFWALALALTPLSSASAILQATPLVVAIGAVLFFGEVVGWRRWSAIAVGFAGVLLVLRPGLEGFEPASIFAVLGMLGFAGRDLATRASPATMTTAQLGVLGFAMLTIAGAILWLVNGGGHWPMTVTWAWIAGATLVGVIAYGALTRAMRTGEMSVVSPFRYSRLIFAMILGVLMFRETPDTLTLLGGAIIVASGVFLLRRSAKR